jgi:hypothetical protein
MKLSSRTSDCMDFRKRNFLCLITFCPSCTRYPTDPPGPENRQFLAETLQKTRSQVGDLPLYYTGKEK